MAEWTRRAFLAVSGLGLAGCQTPGLENAGTPTAETTRTGTGSTPVEDWTTGGFDRQNSGAVSISEPITDPAADWRFEGDNRSDILGAPLVAGETVYAGSGRTVYALSLADGSARWSTETGFQAGIVSPLLTDDRLVVSSIGFGDGEVLGLDRATGDITWRHTLPVSTTPTLVGGHVIVGSTDSERSLVAFDAASGEKAWSVAFPEEETVDGLRLKPAVSGDTVYVPARREGDEPVTELHAVGTDGTDRWSVSIPGEVNAAPSVDRSHVYVGTSAGTVHAIETATEREAWNASVSGPVSSSPAIDGDTIYVGAFENRLYALGTDRGRERWSVEAFVLYTDPVVTEETVYIGGERVQAHRKANGTRRWAYDMLSMAHAEFTSPAVVDGTILVGCCAKSSKNQARYENYVIPLRDGGADGTQ